MLRVITDELFGEKNDDTGDSGGERKCRIHCVKERKHDYRPATVVENEEESELRGLGSRGLWKSRRVR